LSTVGASLLRDTILAVRSRRRLWEQTGLVLVSGLLYSLAISSVGLASRSIGPLVLSTLRLVTAALIFAVILFFSRPHFEWRLRTVLDIALIGVCNIGLTFLLLAMSMRYISSSLAAVLFNFGPPTTIVLAHFILADEKLSWQKIAGVLVAVVGAVVLITSNASGLTSANGQGWIGQLLIIVAAISGGCGIIYTRIRMRGVSTTVLASGQVFASLALMLPVCLLVEGFPPLTSYPWQALVATVVSSVTAPVLAFWLLFYMVKKYSASLGGFASIATPLFSAAIGIVFLGEVITVPIAIGTLLLLAGIWSLTSF
jgi:drug/metabolite transporter (DMT)-like permease